jgi:hypothetical protein
LLNVTNILEDNGLNIVSRNVVVFFVYNAKQVCLTTFCAYCDSQQRKSMIWESVWRYPC